jgi:hypothetical protein
MNTQLQNTLTENSKIKSAAQASSKTMCVEGVEIGDVFISSWGYEQTNIDFYQVVGVTSKSLKLRKIAQVKNYNIDQTSGGTTTPKKDEFISDVFTRRYLLKHNAVKISDRIYADLWDGKPESFTSYA